MSLLCLLLTTRVCKLQKQGSNFIFNVFLFTCKWYWYYKTILFQTTTENHYLLYILGEIIKGINIYI